MLVQFSLTIHHCSTYICIYINIKKHSFGERYGVNETSALSPLAAVCAHFPVACPHQAFSHTDSAVE